MTGRIFPLLGLAILSGCSEKFAIQCDSFLALNVFDTSSVPEPAGKALFIVDERASTISKVADSAIVETLDAKITDGTIETTRDYIKVNRIDGTGRSRVTTSTEGTTAGIQIDYNGCTKIDVPNIDTPETKF